ncbi:MAG: sulfite exporter TauE/SafE family protein [Planctomycetaceae bacterium]
MKALLPFLVPLGIGVASGLLAALCGVGGGIIMVPAFVILLKVSQKVATATSMAVIVPTAIAATVRHVWNDFVDWEVVVLTASSATVVSFFAADYVKKLGNETLTRLFAVVILVVGVKMLAFPETNRRPAPSAVAAQQADASVVKLTASSPERHKAKAIADRYMLPLLIGTASGLLAALCGVGGGIIMVPAFVMLLSGFDQTLATGTSMAVIVPTAIAATSRHIINKLVDWRVFATTAISATLVSFVAADSVKSLGNDTLTRVFAVVIVLVGVKMLISPGTKPAPPPAIPANA